jgi:hypothetical protein
VVKLQQRDVVLEVGKSEAWGRFDEIVKD